MLTLLLAYQCKEEHEHELKIATIALEGIVKNELALFLHVCFFFFVSIAFLFRERKYVAISLLTICYFYDIEGHMRKHFALLSRVTAAYSGVSVIQEYHMFSIRFCICDTPK
jgi:hypothetical protein